MDDKITIVKEWLKFAWNDINCAKHLLSMCPVPVEIVCYHCEQAAEKALKGYLIYQNTEPPKTHILKLLCKICTDIDESFEEISEQCGNLTLYGVQPRYPFEIEITESDMKKAILDADRVMEFIHQRLALIEGITPDIEKPED
ncbi:HEPN domain-containing protein [Candidatus Formimonas warabiya]|uniref:DNA-binding protein n=1 Tax=Formimonas warabiya TaxID=1761012 RepID=A0A3G1KPZ9_FORW1|nr:HEPN domain-containing protein [Candidatus Formimonas warabiya]ATW24510.1 DNA-binding protein [Candidatus Formimonas warabiya]